MQFLGEGEVIEGRDLDYSPIRIDSPDSICLADRINGMIK